MQELFFIGEKRCTERRGKENHMDERSTPSHERELKVLADCLSQRSSNRTSFEFVSDAQRISRWRAMAGDGGVFTSLSCWRHRHFSYCRLACTAPGENIDPVSRFGRWRRWRRCSPSWGHCFWIGCWMGETSGGPVFHLLHRRRWISAAWRGRVLAVEVYWWTRAGRWCCLAPWWRRWQSWQSWCVCTCSVDG